MSGAVRQLEQQVKTILDSIAVSEDRKKELIRGDAVDKAEQLSEWHIAFLTPGLLTKSMYMYTQ